MKNIGQEDAQSLLKETKKVVVYQQDQKNLIVDYTQKQSQIDLKKIGYEIQSDNILDLTHNVQAKEILSKGQFNLSDPKVKVQASQIDFGVGEGLQISLGETTVLRKDQILLQDVDIDNIPEDKDIVINRINKQILLLGRRTQGKQRGLMQLQKKAFQELSFSQHAALNMGPLERHFATFNWIQFLRSGVRKMPVIMAGFVILKTCFEYQYVRLKQMKIQSQQLHYRQQLINRLRLNSFIKKAEEVKFQ